MGQQPQAAGGCPVQIEPEGTTEGHPPEAFSRLQPLSKGESERPATLCASNSDRFELHNIKPPALPEVPD
jgi:hypothetical protein